MKAAHLGARAVMGLLWLLHWLPLPLLAALGQGLGRLLWWLARSRRHVLRVNLQLCFPHWSAEQREQVARQHFGWLVRSLLERGLLRYASDARLRRLVRVQGDLVGSPDDTRPVMWLVPHFVALDFATPAIMLNQPRPSVCMYQVQSNPVFEDSLRAIRSRFGRTTLVSRKAGIRPVIRELHHGAGYVNAADMDFGRKQSVFAPFFGVPTATVFAPGHMARSMNMRVVAVVMEILPRGQGYIAHVREGVPGLDAADPMASATAFNRWLEEEILRMPAQYLWVHKRFKTRPEGEPGVY